MSRHLFALLVSISLLACGGSENVSGAAEPEVAELSAEPSAEPEAEDPSAEAAGAAATGTVDADDARARAIATAEAFVRAQGYTDVPPTVPADQIVHEGIEGTIEMRLNALEPTAVTARGEGEDWTVIFRYRESRYEGRGRAVRLRAGEGPHFVHQDVVVSAWQ